jgi:hypothetical protein
MPRYRHSRCAVESVSRSERVTSYSREADKVARDRGARTCNGSTLSPLSGRLQEAGEARDHERRTSRCLTVSPSYRHPTRGERNGERGDLAVLKPHGVQRPRASDPCWSKQGKTANVRIREKRTCLRWGELRVLTDGVEKVPRSDRRIVIPSA